MEGRPLEQVLRMTAKKAGIAVFRRGASPSIPWKQEVQL